MPDQNNLNPILNNRPPDLTEDFGITDDEDQMDKELMPDQNPKMANKGEKHR